LVTQHSRAALRWAATPLLVAGGQGTQTSTFVAGIFVTNVAGSTVVVDSNGQLGVSASSQRFKKAVEPLDKASEAILARKPVTFQNKTDTTNTPQFGLIAEEVAEVNPDLVVRDERGEIYSVRYDAVNAMLLNEFLKEHEAFVEEHLKVQQQKKEIDVLKTELKEQRALIQKVSDRIELKSSTSQIVANDQ
jgi:endosialidase-like protein